MKIKKKVFIGLAFSLFIIACETTPTISIKVEGNSPTKFLIEHKYCYPSLQVVEIPPENGCKTHYFSDSNKILWSVNIKRDSLTNELTLITYGNTPESYIQKIPNGKPPVPLQEGKLYAVDVICSSLHGDSKLFIIRNGQPVEIEFGKCPSDVPNK